MFRTRIAAVLAALSLSSAPVAAGTITDLFTSFWVFGDSLSDNGNLFAANGGAFPPDPYFEGRFSNGPVWNEDFLDDFAPGMSGNFAFGAARAVPNPPVGAIPDPSTDTIPDFPLQVAIFDGLRPLTLGNRSLASVFFGANDMFATITSAAMAGATDPTLAPGIISAGVRATLASIEGGVRTLHGLGIDEFVLWNLPDLGGTPRLREGGPALAGLGTNVSLAYNSAFTLTIEALRADGLRIHTVDTFALLNRAGDFGLTEVTSACFPVEPSEFLNPAFVPPEVCPTPDSYLYWDKLHPTRVGHAALAAAFDAAVPAIPLPAPAFLLLAGLGGLALFRRRAA
jgi:outer membrane lipase/esterase